MWKWLKDKWNALRKRSYQRGYGCDLCGAELFDYPSHRLCTACEESLPSIKNPCPTCGREGRSEGLCMDCKAHKPSYTVGLAPFTYKAGAGIAVNRLKNGRPKLSAYFGERMAETFRQRELVCVGELLLLPVPMTPSARQRRGYNQAEFLAESVQACLQAEGTACRLEPTLLEKVRDTPPQKKQTRAERAENVEGAYRVKEKGAVQGNTAILIDDVCTTGATGNACAKKLLAAGAKYVYFLTAAIVPEQT